MAELTYKQRLFVSFLLGVSNGNATDAARRAGYAGSDDTLRAYACRLQQNATIKALIEARVASAAMPADEVLARLAEQATASLGDFLEVDERGGWKVDLRRARRSGRIRLLKRVKIKTRSGTRGDDEWTETEVDVEVRDPHAALVKLGEHHGLFKSRIEISGDDGGAPKRLEVPDRDDRHPGRAGGRPAEAGDPGGADAP